MRNHTGTHPDAEGKHQKLTYRETSLKRTTPLESTPLHIISGFLGSGKTTFLMEILSQLPRKMKVGIIQNEFAPASIDGAILKASDHEFHLMEINNGSVFCVCLLGSFADSLQKFLEKHPVDLLFMEASGLSDTTSIAEILMHPALSGKIHLAAHWCVVDALNFSKTGKLMQRTIHQISMADVLLLNKTDLAGENSAELTARLREINPLARLIKTSFCRIPFSETTVKSNLAPPSGQELPGRPAVNSFVIKTGVRISHEGLTSFINRWSPESYRIKGIVNMSDGSTTIVQCTPGTIEMLPAGWKAGTTELIAITDRFTLKEFNQSFRLFALEF